MVQFPNAAATLFAEAEQVMWLFLAIVFAVALVTCVVAEIVGRVALSMRGLGFAAVVGGLVAGLSTWVLVYFL